jgi:hypothetical protein
MLRAGIVLTAFASLTAMVGCASQAQTVGAATGAAIGAAMGGGTIGTVGGAMVGYGAGRAYDERHNR